MALLAGNYQGFYSMKILGISAFYHDAAAVIIEEGNIIAAAQEERFTRKKHDASFPENAIRFCLDFAGCSLNDIDAVAYYEKPFLKFERLIETYYAYAPKGLFSFLKAMPVWTKEKLFLKRTIHKGLKQIGEYDKNKLVLLFPEHHLSHAASAFYPSAFNEAAVLTIDGVGEWATASVCKGSGNKLTVLKELHFPHSVGLLYSAFTYFLGFKVNSGEYKLMGLAPYGNEHDDGYKHFVSIIRTELVNIFDDGSVKLNMDYFNYAIGLTMIHEHKWKALFGFGVRKEDEEPTQQHCNLALALQHVTEEIILKLAAEAKKLTGCEHLCMAGGVALNCVANGRLQEAGLFKDVFIQPAAGDAGGALGAALAAYYIYYDQSRLTDGINDSMQGALLGPAFTNKEILRVLKKHNAVYTAPESQEALITLAANALAEGNVLGWFQERMEFGPRALGARSILADPRKAGMQKKINLKIKYREGFRPFAPAVLAEDALNYFELTVASPYMMLVTPMSKNIRIDKPVDYNEWTLTEKLHFDRSSLPAVTHIDYSARVQTVPDLLNPSFRMLLEAFKEKTGCAVLVNTSFNVRGEPIVHTPEEAYLCFMNTDMDCLAIGDYFLEEQSQPALSNKENYRRTFKPD